MKDLTIIIGISSLIIVTYRILFLMIPMFKKGMSEKNWKIICEAFTLLV